MQFVFYMSINYDSKTIIAISFLERFWVLIPDCLMVILAEVIVDWVKHAFITRFNDIPSNIYQEFTLSLAYDLAATKQKLKTPQHDLFSCPTRSCQLFQIA